MASASTSTSLPPGIQSLLTPSPEPIPEDWFIAPGLQDAINPVIPIKAVANIVIGYVGLIAAQTRLDKVSLKKEKLHMLCVNGQGIPLQYNTNNANSQNPTERLSFQDTQGNHVLTIVECNPLTQNTGRKPEWLMSFSTVAHPRRRELRPNRVVVDHRRQYEVIVTTPPDSSLKVFRKSKHSKTGWKLIKQQPLLPFQREEGKRPASDAEEANADVADRTSSLTLDEPAEIGSMQDNPN